MNDQSLGDTTPETGKPSSTMTPFGDPNAETADEVITPPADVHQWTIEEILGTARPPERHARICLRADLEAEHTMILNELLTLVDAQGKVIDDEDRPMGVQSKAARAQELVARQAVLEAEMAKSMWYPLLRGLTPDALVEFNQKWLPKKDDDEAGWAAYHTQLIAACSVADRHGPKLTVEAVQKLRKTLGANAYETLAKTALAACRKGGTDFPRLPAGFAHLKEQ